MTVHFTPLFLIYTHKEREGKKMKNGVISLGEALVDFIPLDHTNLTYQKKSRGCACKRGGRSIKIRLEIHIPRESWE